MAKLTDAEFVRVWETSSTRQEAADRCGVSPASIGMRAQKLRDLGVELKVFPRGRPKKVTNVDELNALITEMNATTDEP